jgi:anti-anti-sigma factor
MDRFFEIDAYRKGGEVLALLRGSLVMNHCQDAKTRLQTLLRPPVDKIHIHLAELEFLDSAGLGVLVGLKMAASRGGLQLDFLSPQARVEEIFRVSKLDTIFELICGVESDAIRGVLMHQNFCLWRDRKDTHQSDYNTQADFTSIPKSQWTQVVGDGGDEPGSRMNELCTDAVTAIRQGEYDRAIEIYRQMLAIDNDNMSALNNLAVIYEKKASWYPLARESWDRVLELSEQRGDERHATRARAHIESLKKLMR